MLAVINVLVFLAQMVVGAVSPDAAEMASPDAAAMAFRQEALPDLASQEEERGAAIDLSQGFLLPEVRKQQEVLILSDSFKLLKGSSFQEGSS